MKEYVSVNAPNFSVITVEVVVEKNPNIWSVHVNGSRVCRFDTESLAEGVALNLARALRQGPKEAGRA